MSEKTGCMAAIDFQSETRKPCTKIYSVQSRDALVNKNVGYFLSLAIPTMQLFSHINRTQLYFQEAYISLIWLTVMYEDEIQTVSLLLLSRHVGTCLVVCV